MIQRQEEPKRRSEEELKKLLDSPVPVSAVFAERTLSLPRLKDLEPGSVIPLGNIEGVTLKAGEATVARGIVVQIGDQFGIQIESVRSRRDLLSDQDVQTVIGDDTTYSDPTEDTAEPT